LAGLPDSSGRLVWSADNASDKDGRKKKDKVVGMVRIRACAFLTDMHEFSSDNNTVTIPGALHNQIDNRNIEILRSRSVSRQVRDSEVK